MIVALMVVLAILLFWIVVNEFFVKVVQGDSLSNHFIGEGKNKHDKIAVGSTYCRYALNEENNGLLNLGIDGSFFYYTDKILRHYAPISLKPGGIVYIICADLVFAREGKGLYGPEKYIGILNKDELGDDYTTIRYLKYRFPLMFNPIRFKSFIGYLIRGRNSSFENTTTNPFTKEDVFEFSKNRCESWCKQFGLKDTITPVLPSSIEEEFIKTRRLLTNMIDYCLQSGYKPVLVVTPLCDIMNNLISDEFIDKVLYSNIRKANTQGVQFLDYLRDKRFADYHLYDKSGDCLNARGRKLFTEILIKDTL